MKHPYMTLGRSTLGRSLACVVRTWWSGDDRTGSRLGESAVGFKSEGDLTPNPTLVHRTELQLP